MNLFAARIEHSEPGAEHDGDFTIHIGGAVQRRNILLVWKPDGSVIQTGTVGPEDADRRDLLVTIDVPIPRDHIPVVEGGLLFRGERSP